MQDKLGAVFDMDKPLMRVLGTVTDIIILNVATVLCMVPVVTYGAALTARDDVLWHMVRGEETYIIKSYFKSFKRNLRQGTLMGFFFLIVAGLLILYFNMVRAVPATQSLIFYAIILFIAIFVLAVGIYAFALLSRYENSIPATLKNAVILNFAFLPRTLAMVFIVVGAWLAFIAFYQILFPIMLLMGTSLPGYLCALLYNRVFTAIEG